LELEREIREWVRRGEPHRRDISHPAWKEWQRNAARADWVKAERRLEDPRIGRSYAKAVRDIESTLTAALPVDLVGPVVGCRPPRGRVAG
jgi:hypothetical protein